MADDLLEGRDTTERGQKIAARYLASQMAVAGIRPAYPDSEDPYFQVYGLQSRVIETGSEITLEGEGPRERLTYMEDYDNLVSETMQKAAPITFVGYGIKTESYDDYAGLDVKGHWVVILEGPPSFDQDHPLTGVDPRGFRGFTRFNTARVHDALGVIYLKDRAFDFSSFDRPSLEGAEQADRRFGDFPMIRMPREKRRALFGDHFDRFEKALAAMATEHEPQSFTLNGRTLALTQTASRKVETAENVIGILPGSDPELKHEYVVVSAHYDHIGTDERNGVFNGADDNASGTACVLMLGKYLREETRRRSLILLLVSGEEMGLLGSSWFVDHPNVPLDQIVANINLDMIGRNAPETMGLIPALREGVTTMRPLAEEVNRNGNHGFRFHFGWDRFHRRSDHYNFAKNDIPAIFFFSGTHDDYHRVGDDWQKLDYEKMTRFFEFLSELTSEILNRDERPAFLDAEARKALSSE